MVSSAKAFFRSELGDRIDVHFNPAELVITKAASWQASEAKGGNAPKLTFQGGQSGTLKMKLTLDTTASGSPVTEATDKLLGLLKVNPALPGADPARQSARPPWVEFHWGPLHSFKAIVESLTITYTYFAASGMPLRAKADIALKQWDDEALLPLQNPTSGTRSPHTVHHTRPGETLDRVAAHYYRDPTRWRAIAEANGVVDPMRVPAGTPLVVPELPVRRRG
jgi:nucleoid-associated protein YgaU